MNKRLASAGLVAGLLAGGAAGVVLGVNGVSSASTTPSVVVDDSATTTADNAAEPTDDATDDTTDADRPARGEWLTDALQPLIDDGTLTQAQADAVITALQDARPAGGFGPGRHGHGHGHGARFGSGVVADVLGMTPDELRDALRDGQTLAEIATQQGVELQAVVDAMVAEAEAHLAEKVADGRLTQEEADARLAEIAERIDERVNEPVTGAEGS